MFNTHLLHVNVYDVSLSHSCSDQLVHTHVGYPWTRGGQPHARHFDTKAVVESVYLVGSPSTSRLLRFFFRNANVRQVEVMDVGLRQDFGFKHILWVYSGRRGVHCWVADDAARALTNEGRGAVADYFGVVAGNDNQSKKVRQDRSMGRRRHGDR